MRNLRERFDALQKSAFRARFRLGPDEQRYLENRSLDTVMQHARMFILQRLADAQPARDGKQTPLRGHPVFIAQHATATCCRGCLAKWHGIEKGCQLSAPEIDYVLAVIRRWLEQQPTKQPEPRRRGLRQLDLPLP